MAFVAAKALAEPAMSTDFGPGTGSALCFNDSPKAQGHISRGMVTHALATNNTAPRFGSTGLYLLLHKSAGM